MPELVSPLQVVPADILALLFLVSAASQFGFIAAGAWLFQEPDERLTRRKGLGFGLTTYAWVAMASAAGTLVHPFLGPVVFLVLTTTVLKFGFRTLVKMWIASVILGAVLFAMAKPEAGPTENPQQKQKKTR